MESEIIAPDVESRPVAEEPGARSARLGAVDRLRGLVMVVMALDHTRDYFYRYMEVNPMGPAETHLGLFLTRWVTHFCAPTFVFLAGVGAFLYGSRGRSRGELSRFLLSRGLWLVVVEHTVVRTGWLFQFHANFFMGQVIWAIGLSMVGLSALVFLPRRVVGTLGVLVVAGHNMLDGLKAERLGAFGPLWKVLHEPSSIDLTGGWELHVPYSVLPWLGVMMAGFGFGELLLDRDVRRRSRRMIALGLALTASFVALRSLNGYGDPRPWVSQSTLLQSAYAFLDCQKYPPSLMFCLMTLGPAIALLGLFDRGLGLGPLDGPLITFGRVPLFFYVLHLYVIHAAAVGMALVQLGPDRVRSLMAGPFNLPDDYGVGLPGVYLAWVLIVATLYVPCRWFAGVKARHRDSRLLSYL